jgi:IS5 family transposase
MRFIGLALHEPVPDARTIWLYREQLRRAGSLKRLFARFDRVLRERGYLAMGGQIVDATIIEARRPRLTEAEKETIKGGGVPAEWTPARRAQIDRDGRWTLKRGKKRHRPAAGNDQNRAASEIVIPAFGYKNHVGIDRTHGFVRRFTVTHAAAADGRELGRLLDGDNLASSVWADTAYRSQANLRLLDRRGLVPEFQAGSRAASRCPPTSAGATPLGAGASQGRACLPGREAATTLGHPDHRPGARNRQNHARQPDL